MSDTSMINNMTEGPLGRQLVKFSLPYMLASLMQTLYTMVDLAIVGQFVGSVGLSAVSISGTVTMLLYALGVGGGSGGQILISQQVGAGDYEKVGRTWGTFMSFTAICAVAMMLLGFVIAKPAMSLLNTPPEAVDSAVSYLLICCAGIPFTYIYGSMSDALRGMGDSKRPMLFIFIASMCNIVLDLLFVAVFHWGVAGAAWATVISQVVSSVFAGRFFYTHRKELGVEFQWKTFAIDKKILGTIVRLSMPLVFMTVSINISMMFVNSYINAYGIVASSVSGVGGKLYSLMNVVTNAVMSASATVVGQNIAAGKPDRVKKSMYVGWALCVSFCVVVGLLMVLFPKQVFGVFSSDAEVLALAPKYLKIAFWMYLSFALMAPPLGLINGVGFTSLNLGIAILDGVVARIGLSLLFGITMGMGLEGFWWGSSLAAYVSVILAGAYFFSGRWQKRKLLA